ncbi:DUF5790 family protein [Saliphagus infecundisoli]|uniref:DUF5790 family protein n=1 Tax=Saliphagus infecundisoli TaxID=1849069 RepID=A0ABD5QBT8_9EURY|nr:DUF5790 family protein [Saliphagus infecundisoli]
MSQSALDDDELFGEAASEMRDDVESSLSAAREALPEADAVWEAEADNVLGVLNTLDANLEAGDAEEHLRDAKKWYTMGERAEAFEDASDLESEIEALEETVEQLSTAGERIDGLPETMLALKESLEDAETGAGDGADGGNEGEDEDEDEE